MPSADLIAELRCNGQIYTGWKTVSVKRDYGTNSVTAFQFSAAENTKGGSGWANLRLKPGDAVQVYLGGVKVCDGFITTRQTAFDDKSHDVVLAGMSKTLDLVASSLPVKPGSMSGKTFEQAARYAVAGTGVGVVIKNPPPIASKPFKNLNVQPGETRFEFIERLARFRGLMLTDDADGNLVCSRSNPQGRVVAELVEGFNILRARAILDDQSAFSSLSITGQFSDPDADMPPRAVSASVQQDGLTRPGRDRVVVSEGPGDGEDHKVRLGAEVARSLWPVVNCTIVVPGWKRSDGKLWDVTDNVTVKSPMLFPSQSGSLVLGVQSTTFTQDTETGTTTTLDLVLPTALTSLGHPGIQVDDKGDVINNPTPGTPKVDTPDYVPGGSGDTDAPL